MLIRARAPLRIGLAGGGTDVSPYSEIYGGAILNASISMFAHASIEPLSEAKVVLSSVDRNITEEFGSDRPLDATGELSLIKAICNRVMGGEKAGFKLTTHVDAPYGSGLGSSSTLVVAILGAFAEWRGLALGDYDLAHLAYEIERVDMGMVGGKQDQYAATFGGINFMEFSDGDRVIVNPLRIKPDYLRELEHNLVLYYTGTSRISSEIIEHQVENVRLKKEDPIQAMHELKDQAVRMKEAVLKGNFGMLGELLDYGWQKKKRISDNITNPVIDEIYAAAILAGATGGKLSGAGGGGFMCFYCPGNTRYAVARALTPFGGQFRQYKFEESGLNVWRR